MNTFKLDAAQIMTIAMCVITAASSFIASEQQKQANHDIAVEVANIIRDELREGSR